MVQPIKKKIQKHLEEHISIYIFILALFIMGVIFGAIVVNSLPYEAKSDLFHYLKRFFNEIKDGTLASSGEMFSESFAHYLRYLGVIWLLGLSIIGLPVIFVLLFIKGVVVGFTVGFLVNQMGLHGFWLALGSVFPQNIILIPLFIIVSAASVAFSLKIIRHLLMKTRKQPLMPQFGRYALIMVSVVLVAFVISVYEAYIAPELIQSIVR